MKYLLDTNACIALVNGKSPSIPTRLQRALAAEAAVALSAVVAFELWYGGAKSARQESNAQLLEKFFAPDRFACWLSNRKTRKLRALCARRSRQQGNRSAPRTS